MKRKASTGTLRRFVARAISDTDKAIYGYRLSRRFVRRYAETAIRAVARGRKRGLR